MKLFKGKMYCEPLRASRKNEKKINTFHIEREQGYSNPEKTGYVIGLEAYLKYCAWKDDLSRDVKVYLVKSYFENEIVAYFALKSGLIVLDDTSHNLVKEELAEKQGTKLVPQTIPGIEISHFAVNDTYRHKHGKNGESLKGLGNAIYPDFIYPIIKKTASLIGIKCAYLYAAGDQSLINYYHQVFEFKTISQKNYIPIKPYYDSGCQFMYYLL